MEIVSLPLSETFSRTYVSAQNININTISIKYCDVTISYFEVVSEPNVSENMNLHSTVFHVALNTKDGSKNSP